MHGQRLIDIYEERPKCLGVKAVMESIFAIWTASKQYKVQHQL